MDIFVRESDTVNVDVYAWEKDDTKDLTASNDEADIPEGVDAQIIKFSFRRPTYQDSNTILRTASMTGDVSNSPDLMAFQDAIIRALLLEVTVDDATTDMRQAKINSLHPNIARAAIAGILDKVTI